MEPYAAAPTVAIIDHDERAAAKLAAVLEAAGYVVGWYRQPWGLLDEIMEECPTVVILAGSQPQRFDRWSAAQALHEMGSAVILATNDEAARREVFATTRGRHCVDSVRLPYEPLTMLATVSRAVQRYPYNLWIEPDAAVSGSGTAEMHTRIA
jgi:FixJ family two-component response regulator